MIDPQLALIRNLDDAGCDKTTQKLFLQSCSDEVPASAPFNSALLPSKQFGNCTLSTQRVGT